jgi:peptide/nickel transport system permease protein
MERALGLDAPLVVQYGRWLRDISTGKLGESLLRGDSVNQFVLRRGPITLEIAVIALVLSWVVGFPIGIMSALKPNTWMDFVGRIFSILFVAIPGFWLGLLIVVALILWFNYKSPIVPVYLWQDPWKNLQMVAGPALVMGLGFAGFVARMARSSLLEVVREDYVRTARAKGLPERIVVVKHALRAGLTPIVTAAGLDLAYLLGGAIITENIFNLPGLGSLAIGSVLASDLPLISGITLVAAALIIVANLVVDLLYAVVDPRVRVG